MKKKINLEEIVLKEVGKMRVEYPKENWISNEILSKSIEMTMMKNMLREAVKQALELAAENAEIDTINMGSSEFQTIISKSSIINTINQIE